MCIYIVVCTDGNFKAYVIQMQTGCYNTSFKILLEYCNFLLRYSMVVEESDASKWKLIDFGFENKVLGRMFGL
jgi:hypothetical protein